MKLAIMQPYLFPYLGYFQLIHACDRFVFYDDVNFIKNGWINRNRLLLGCKDHYFTVPLSDASPFKPIREIRIQPDPRWRRKMLQTFRSAYARAPFVRAGMELVEDTLAVPGDAIADLARHSVVAVMRYLGLERDVVETSSTYGNADLKGPRRVLDICKREGATVYVNAPGGRHLYEQAEFRQLGVELRFVGVNLPEYPQGCEQFVPGLSILDMLMRCPREEVAAMIASHLAADGASGPVAANA